MIFYNGVNVLSMSNEELAIRIKNGSAELVGELWENTSKTFTSSQMLIIAACRLILRVAE